MTTQESGMDNLQMIKGTVAGFVALIACPCHLPLTLPALLLFTSGTVIGVWLAANQWLVWLVAVLLFAGGLALAFRWFGHANAAAVCEVPPNRNSSSVTPAMPGGPKRLEISNQSQEGSHV